MNLLPRQGSKLLHLKLKMEGRKGREREKEGGDRARREGLKEEDTI